MVDQVKGGSTMIQTDNRNLYGLERLRHWLLAQNWFSSYLLPALPRSVRWALRSIYLAPLDLVDRVRGRDSALTPPRALNFTGAVSDLAASAETYVKNLVDLADLQPSSKVLDIGSGFGRLAVGLIPFRNKTGSYDGLEIVPAGVEWCNKNIAASHANIRFHYADVFNKEYNPKGRLTASEYKFTFDDAMFDLIVVTSVFTHMLPDAVDNYMNEIARVLKPGGRCYITYLILTEESRRLMTGPDSIMKFKHNCGSYWLVSKKVPELSVGYEEYAIKQLYTQYSLHYKHYPGNWCGQTSQWVRAASGSAEQDVVVATKIA
jgi:SAM-dependent methyltransferase